jgi:purine-binding chemotaxis protein CheW
MAIINVVEFEINGERYALDIGLSREIVEMIPITPVPRAPYHIAGIINLRGEITNIINLNRILAIPDKENREEQKIIVLIPEAAEGSNVGIIVDNVHSVLQVSDDQIEEISKSVSNEAYIKNIIKIGEDKEDGSDKKRLIMWLDVAQILRDILEANRA